MSIYAINLGKIKLIKIRRGFNKAHFKYQTDTDEDLFNFLNSFTPSLNNDYCKEMKNNLKEFKDSLTPYLKNTYFEKCDLSFKFKFRTNLYCKIKAILYEESKLHPILTFRHKIVVRQNSFNSNHKEFKKTFVVPYQVDDKFIYTKLLSGM